MNVQVVSRIAERLKTYNLRKLGNYKKVPEMSEFDGKYSASTQKPNFDVFGKISQKISGKTFHRKIYFA